MVNNKGEPAKTEKTWEDFVRALPKMEKNMLKENAPLQPKVIFHIIREEGEEEMSRSLRALAFSALAAGVLSLSPFCSGLAFVCIWQNTPGSR